jgi:AcrR family transcriptional regulator
MKTRDRILYTSLLLFNVDGEASTTTVDIANELDISPGNLYYHFKGKDIIIAELFVQFEASISEILNAPTDHNLKLEDNWFYLYVVFEEIYNYRFFYRNLTDLIERYPELRKKFQRLLALKTAAIEAVLDNLSRDGELTTSPEERKVLVDNIVLLLTYWLNYQDLRHEEMPPAVLIHQGVFQMLAMIAPYLGDQHLGFYHQCQEIYRATAQG